jgi:hypothetical protein
VAWREELHEKKTAKTRTLVKLRGKCDVKEDLIFTKNVSSRRKRRRRKLGTSDCKASDRWLKNVRNRHNIAGTCAGNLEMRMEKTASKLEAKLSFVS